jgi:hypothetical protein
MKIKDIPIVARKNILGSGEKFCPQVKLICSVQLCWWMITHKYRGSRQSSREVKPKFSDSTQGEVKNTYKP